MANQDWLWPTLKHALFDDLAKVHQLSGGWDLVIFSGDLVQSGEKAEYDRLNAILGELWDHFAKLGCTPELIVLPGNHDLKRPTMNSVFRTLKRWWEEPDVQAEFFRSQDNEYRLAVAKMLEQYSGWFVEHPFGTLKCRAGYRHFLVRGLDKVRGEWSLMALCYNFTRVLNILGFEAFVTSMAKAFRSLLPARSAPAGCLKLLVDAFWTNMPAWPPIRRFSLSPAR